MAGFLTQDWEIPPEMDAELDRLDAEEPLPDPDEDEQTDDSSDTAASEG